MAAGRAVGEAVDVGAASLKHDIGLQPCVGRAPG